MKATKQGHWEWIMHERFRLMWSIEFSALEHHILKSPSQGLVREPPSLNNWSHVEEFYMFGVWSVKETKWPNIKCNASGKFKDNRHYENKEIMGTLHKDLVLFESVRDSGVWRWIAINCNGVPFCAVCISLSYIFLAAGRKQRALIKEKRLQGLQEECSSYFFYIP